MDHNSNIVVVLPAPLWPRRAVIVPFSNEIVRLSIIFTLLYVLHMSTIWTAGNSKKKYDYIRNKSTKCNK